VGAAIGVAVATDVAVGVALGVVAVESDPQDARTVAAATPANETSLRCIALEGTCCGRIMRTSSVSRQLLVRAQDRGEEIPNVGDTLPDRGDVPTVGSQLRVVEFLPRDGGRHRSARRRTE
jgi:hypothetical protein